MEYNELLKKYNEAIRYISLLEKENEELKIELAKNESIRIPENYEIEKANKDAEVLKEDSENYYLVDDSSSNREKLKVYLSLFKGREDVCAKRWVSRKTGSTGYSPFCQNEWVEGVCGKKNKVKCTKCQNQNFYKYDEDVLRKHLRGEEVLGLYPLDKDDMCYLIVMDFDKGKWQDEIKIVSEVCDEANIPYYIERSRSGEGGHIWFFFRERIKASKARKFASVILDKAMEKDSHISFDSYDRLIPSQDFMNKDGFGNLIALPFQKFPREKGNSVFVDEKFDMIDDQWALLSIIRKIHESEIEQYISLNSKKVNTEESMSRAVDVSKLDFPEELTIVLRNGIVIKKKGLSSKGIVFFRRMASYLNPEFYSKQAMRMSTYNTPRMTVVYEENESLLILPIGLMSKIIDQLAELKIPVNIIDEQESDVSIDVNFNGKLREEQKVAFENLVKYDNGVLSATTGFGKTVLGACLIAEKITSTLIIVHTKELALQWMDRLEEFLDIKYEVEPQFTKTGRIKKTKLIGQLGGGKKQLTGKIDIALVQSLINTDKTVKKLVNDYGMVIVDECHHAASPQYRQVLSQLRCKFIYGLTATPIRKDGHYRIIFMYCGPIRYKVDAKKKALERNFEHYVVPRFTSCRKPLYQEEKDWHISDQMKHVCENNVRNNLIVSDVDRVIEDGRNPIILTERSSHIEIIKSLMIDKPYEVIELSGRLKTKDRKIALQRIRNKAKDEKVVIIATGKLVGEGFDVPWLDTLFLGMPIAWKGTIAQYAGRLHREAEGKNEVCVYDYVDVHMSRMANMYSKRLSAYKNVGYKIKVSGINKNSGDEIYSGDNYFKDFTSDIRESSKSIILSVPFIQKRKYESIKEILFSKFNEGVRVVICIKEIEEYKEKTKVNMHRIFSELENNGIDVYQVQGLNYKFAIFDDEVVWYGGVSLLAGNRTEDSVIRIRSGALSDELLGVLE